MADDDFEKVKTDKMRYLPDMSSHLWQGPEGTELDDVGSTFEEKTDLYENRLKTRPEASPSEAAEFEDMNQTGTGTKPGINDSVPAWFSTMPKIERYVSALEALQRSGLNLKESFEIVDGWVLTEQQREKEFVRQHWKQSTNSQIASGLIAIAQELDNLDQFDLANQIDDLLFEVTTSN